VTGRNICCDAFPRREIDVLGDDEFLVHCAFAQLAGTDLRKACLRWVSRREAKFIKMSD
jgi:hypothetical protein